MSSEPTTEHFQYDHVESTEAREDEHSVPAQEASGHGGDGGGHPSIRDDDTPNIRYVP